MSTIQCQHRSVPASRFNGTTLMEREEEAEKEPAAQAPSLLMQGEEVHEH